MICRKKCSILCSLFLIVALTFINTSHGLNESFASSLSQQQPQPHYEQDKHLSSNGFWPLQEKGYCAPYNGKICKNFIRGQVWYSREDPTGGWKNEQIATALWEELITELTGLCRQAAEVLIIIYLFYYQFILILYNYCVIFLVILENVMCLRFSRLFNRVRSHFRSPAFMF